MMRTVLPLVLLARVALAADGGTSGNFLNCRVTQSFEDGGSSWAVSVFATPLPNDAARASKQPAIGRAGAPSRDVLSIQGVPFGRPVKADINGQVVQVFGSVSLSDAGSPFNINPPASLPLPTGAATDLRQDTGNASLSSIDSKTATAARQDTGNASLANLDVALSTRTKPSDQQHVIIDTAASTPVTAAALPLPAGAATDATLSGLFDGGVVAQGQLPSGASRPIALTESGAIWVRQLPSASSLLLPCNLVRRTNCR